MRESIHRFFRVGVIQWMSYPRLDPMESLKKICRDDYFDAVEVKGWGGIPQDAEGKRLLEQSHMKVCFGAQPHLLGPGLNARNVPYIRYILHPTAPERTPGKWNWPNLKYNLRLGWRKTMLLCLR